VQEGRRLKEMITAVREEEAAAEGEQQQKIKIKKEYEDFAGPQSEDEWEGMLESMRRRIKKGKSGQAVPGIVNQDYVLIDGHHRRKACKLLGIPFLYEIHYYEDELEEIQEIFDLNDKRRHCTAFQRGKMALKMEPYLQKKAKRNLSLAGKHKEAFANIGEPSIDVREEIAKRAKLSHGTR